MSVYEVAIFYKYLPIERPAEFCDWQRETCEVLALKGRILIAKEGINGTVEGTAEAIAEYGKRLRTLSGFEDLWMKTSPGTGNAFCKLKVKVRKEIVATGLSAEEDVDPTKNTGKYLEADELKEWIEKGEEFAIIDMRNDYEYAVGHFAGSRPSGMGNFRDLPKIVAQHAEVKDKKVLTVCTYGVRCEKASAYLLQQGFQDVYQLHGGIGTYMKKFPGQDFQGSLYVFDERMTERFTEDYEAVGTCVGCEMKSERFGNCAWDECHKQLIICENCSKEPVWCSTGCAERRALA